MTTTIDDLIQSMREAGSLANIRKCAEKLQRTNPRDYKALCDFYASVKQVDKPAGGQ